MSTNGNLRCIKSFRALMEASGLEPRVVSGRMGYPYTQFRAILNGEVPVPDEFVRRAAEMLEVPEAVFEPERGAGVPTEWEAIVLC